MLIKSFIALTAILFSIGLTCFLSKYISYQMTLRNFNGFGESPIIENKSKILDRMNYNVSHPLIRSLADLVEVPFVGQFFMEDKIYELAKLENWEAVAH